jgi:ATP-binding cassette subfamily B protein
MGDHAGLLAEKGLYYAMWRQQIGERKYASASPEAINVPEMRSSKN